MKDKKQLILCADFETTGAKTKYFQEKDDVRVQLWNIREYKSREKIATGISMESFFECLEQLNHSCIIYFHNLTFDGDFILKYLSKKYKMYQSLRGVKRVGFSAFIGGSKIFNIVYKYIGKGNNGAKVYRTLTFKCSYSLLSAPIDALGKDLGLLKIKDGVNPDDLYNMEPVEHLKEYQKDEIGQTYIDYCENDTLIQIESLKAFGDTLEELPKTKYNYNGKEIELKFLKDIDWTSKNVLTISGLGLRYQKKLIQWNPLFVRKDKNGKDVYHGKEIAKGLKHSIKDNMISDFFYSGGFTQFNIEYQSPSLIPVKFPVKKGVCIDVNSMHPANMCKKLPYGELYDMEKDNFKHLGLTEDDVCEFYVIDFDSAKSHQNQIACILNFWKKEKAVKKKHEKIEQGLEHELTDKDWADIDIDASEMQNRYFIHVDKPMRVYYLREEWECLNKFHTFKNVRYVKHYWMRAGKYLELFVKLFYSQRQIYKKQGKKAQSNTYKIFLNSAYGVHGKRAMFREIYVCKDKQEYDSLELGMVISMQDGNKLSQYRVVQKDTVMLNDGNQFIVLLIKLNITSANNKFIAATITAYSRIMLWEMMMVVGFKNVVYCDTDSLYLANYSKALEKQLTDANLIDGVELGKWDRESWESKGVLHDTFYYITIFGAKRYEIYDKDKNKLKSVCCGIDKRQLKKDNFTFDWFNKDGLIEQGGFTKKRCSSGILLVESQRIIKKGSQ